MNKYILCLSLCVLSAANLCKQYPLDPLACIEKTNGISCQFNFFENACIQSIGVQYGCSQNLNKKACLQQISRLDGNEVFCYFRTRCHNANVFHLRNFDCQQDLSLSACVNLRAEQCIWNNDRCQSYQEDIPIGNTCDSIFNAPVSPSLCAQILNIPCYNSGFRGGYKCTEVLDSNLEILNCDTLGINQMACISIKTQGEKCIFKNGVCQRFQVEDEISCSENLNKEACLGITNLKIMCIWNAFGCQNFLLENQEEKECSEYSNINPSVCSTLKKACSYDEISHSCIKPNIFDCNTSGLSQGACLQIQTQQCLFDEIQGCLSVTKEQLNLFDCDRLLNQQACLNITQQSQYCQWSEQKCQRILINQDVDCPLPQNGDISLQVNGNVCQAISKNNIGCKYNQSTNLCEKSSGLEQCNQQYLNLYACVQINQRIACKWNEDTFNCEFAKIIDQVTKCKDLKYANPIACSQITEIRNNLGIGCYYNDDTQQCAEIDDDSLRDMECLQKGLNKFGCTMIIKLGQKCRWVRGQCISIRSKEQIAQVSCLDLQFVNPGTCAMATFNKEVWCVNTIDSSDTGDYCDTLGLNSIACQQITRNPTGCYFDKINYLCVTGPDSNSSNEVELAKSYSLLNTAKCTGNSPTRNICIAIQTLGQYCSWNSRNLSCENQYVQINEKCLDYNTGEKQKTVPGAQVFINANVCASIVMNYPNQDPKSGLTPIDPLRGYCQYDGKGNCIKFIVTPCSDPCCTQVPGINAHVCSRYTTGQYCYFNEFNKCVQLKDDIVDTTSPQAIKDFYNFKQYQCSSMNKNSCTMIDWSPTQQCYWDGNVCTQINFENYSSLSIDLFIPSSLSRYACQSIEGDKGKIRKYFKYDPILFCIESIIDLSNCEVPGINSNNCLGKTSDQFCKWDKVNLICKTIDDYLQIYTCNEYQNKKACINNPYVPCAFLDSSDKCISSPQNINCYDFNIGQIHYGWVNAKACANIIKPGQICSYDSISNKCQSAGNILSQTCDLQGINSIGCYQNSQGNCRWDQINLQCYEEGDQEIIANLKCNDNVNKKLCLQITIDNCEWSTVDMRCSSMEKLKIVNSTSYYNAQACTSLLGDAYYYDYNNGNSQCVKLTTFNNDCTSKIMNKQACLLNTQGHKCFFDQTQTPDKKCQNFKDEQMICNSVISINIEICTNIPQSCYFDSTFLTCQQILVQSSLKCSSLIVQGLFYNKIACSSISDTITDSSTNTSLKICTQSPLQQNAQQCYFEKYCQWNKTTYSCSLVQIGDGRYSPGENSSPSCSLSKADLQCQNIYSRAVCLQFIKGCYFDISQGGCQAYSQNLYKVQDCSYMNGTDCEKSKTDNAYCKTKLAPTDADFTPNCEIQPLTLDTCELDQDRKQKSCSTVDKDPSICAQAIDLCYFNSNNCISPVSFSDITCSTQGVSRALCIILNPPCDFSSGQCTSLKIPSLNQDNSNYFNVCNEVNYLISYKNEYVCGQIITTPCQFKLNSCQNAFYQQCQDLLGLSVSLMACNQCRNLSVSYDYSLQQCVQISTLDSDCDTKTQNNCQTNNCQWNSEICHLNLQRLNKSSCLKLTTKIQAIWDDDINQCITISDNSLSQKTDCSILSRKACLRSSPSCWVNSETLQCDTFSQILATCAEVVALGGQKQHCLVSYKEPCKYTTTCVKADLNIDNCTGLNKYGCLNMQKQKNCGWSDKDKQCIDFNPNFSNGCTNYAQGGYQNYNEVNPIVCAQLVGLNNLCFYDKRTNKCTSVGTQTITCSQNIGINKLACLRSTKDKCKFDDANKQCIPITNSDKQCQPSLNQVTCLSFTDSYCEFYLDACNPFYLDDKGSVAAAIVRLPIGKIISASVCVYYNQKIPNAYFIYNPVRNYCLNANMQLPTQYFALCSSISISEKVCLEKTMEFCIYENSSCKQLSIDQIRQQKICNYAFSWKACIAINALCKFSKGRCIPIESTDTCLSISGAIDVFVGPQVCAQFSTPCKYSQINFKCQVVITPNEPCNSSGLSKKACLEYTTTSFCIYDNTNNTCSSTYDNTLSCSDTSEPKKWYVNTAKCYFIQKPGNYCEFKNGECTQIPENTLSSCNVPARQTNPITCQKATNAICFYIPATNYCVIETQENLDLQLQKIIISFNKQSCIKYDSVTNKVKLIWDDINGCLELTNNDLANIQCNSPVNRLACVSITNPTQYCQFNIITSKCQFKDLSTPPQLPIDICSTLINVNRFEFCQYASDNCMYNSFTRKCIAVADLNDLKNQILNEDDCFDKGMSAITCNTLTPTCSYHNIRKFCYGGKIFCNDSDNSTTCKNVSAEPCQLQGDACLALNYDQLKTIECKNAVNLLGCTSITNPSKLCQYDKISQTCKDLTVLNNACSTYLNINNKKVCEQTTDVACKFDFISKSCKEVQLSDQFECDRGLNLLACINYTRKSLQCQFRGFCIGPTFEVNGCSDLVNKEVCLNYDYECIWDSTQNICVNYNLVEQTCLQLEQNQTVVSSQVCYNSIIENGACMYDINTNTCKFYIPQRCEDLQTQKQCINMNDLPCFWSNEKCNFFLIKDTDTCQTIANNGSKLACLSIYRQGQQCQYINNQCVSYIESKTENNCLSKINKIACLTQQTDSCYWKIDTKMVYDQQITYGTCQPHQENPLSESSSLLSYQACFTVKKIGQFCRWNNNNCQQIIVNSNQLIKYDTFSLINSNSCGLVNVGKVKYNKNTKSCIEFQNDAITCQCGAETPGLNKAACLSIKNEPCKWIDQFKICIEYKSKCDIF